MSVRTRAGVAALLLVGTCHAVGGAALPADAEPGPQDTWSGRIFAEFDSYGPIPDESPSCGTAGAPLEVRFEVSGLPTRRITSLYVRFSISHPSVGDVDATLVAPDGTERVLFEDTGGGCGDDDGPVLNAAYGFADDATQDWWSTAADLGRGQAVPAGGYRASDATGAPTSLVAGFADVVDPNGTWVLRVTDDWNGRSGRVSAAELGMTVDTTAPDVRITAGPADQATVTDPPTYEFGTGHDDVEQYRCRVDFLPDAPCTSPWRVPVRTGSHFVTITAVDRSGQRSAPVVRRFTLDDRVPPETLVAAGPGDGAIVTEPPEWELGSPDGDVVEFRCGMDGAQLGRCASPWRAPTTAPGFHEVWISAVDEAGNFDLTPVVRRFHLRDVACEEAEAALAKAERRLERARVSGDRTRIRHARQQVRAARAAVAAECADAPATVRLALRGGR